MKFGKYILVAKYKNSKAIQLKKYMRWLATSLKHILFGLSFFLLSPVDQNIYIYKSLIAFDCMNAFFKITISFYSLYWKRLCTVLLKDLMYSTIARIRSVKRPWTLTYYGL